MRTLRLLLAPLCLSVRPSVRLRRSGSSKEEPWSRDPAGAALLSEHVADKELPYRTAGFQRLTRSSARRGGQSSPPWPGY